MNRVSEGGVLGYKARHMKEKTPELRLHFKRFSSQQPHPVFHSNYRAELKEKQPGAI